MTQLQPDETLEGIAKAKGSECDIRPMLACIIREFGGYEGIAKLLFTDYCELPAKSPSRERLLTNVLRLIGHATVTDASGGEGQDKDEVERAIKAKIRELLKIDED
jgi:hypothetical protein